MNLNFINRLCFTFCLFLCISLFTGSAVSQNIPTTDSDTVFIKKDTRLIISDSLYVFNSDTTIIFPDSIIRQNPELKTYILYLELEKKSQKSFVTRELYKAAFTSHHDILTNDTIDLQKSEKRFTPWNGKVIRKIYYKVLQAIGSNVTDTSSHHNTKFFDWLNNSYPSTRTFVIKNNLLFHQGDRIVPMELSNSERILREQRSIKDARISISELQHTSDSVDLIVVVKDVYPFGVAFKNTGLDKYEINFFTVNFKGWGHYFNNAITITPTESTFLIYSKFEYIAPNIAGSFIDIAANYESSEHSNLKRIKAIRNYLPLKSSMGGIAKIERNRYHLGIAYDYPPQVAFDSSELIPVGFLEKEAVVGYSIITTNQLNNPSTYVVIAGSYLGKNFFDRPTTSIDTNIRYQNRTDFLASFSFLRNNYYQTRYINSFGITEDVPYGLNLTLTGGYELGELFNRPYGGASFSAGNFITNIGYFYMNCQAGSFLMDNELKQGLFSFETMYFTNLFKIKERYKSRISFWSYYAVGLNRYNNEKMFVLNLYRSQRYDLYKFEGNQQLNLSTGITTFTPWYLYGFQFAYELFFETTLVGQSNKSVFKNRLYSGIGLGMKIKNESLVFETIDIRFVYFPVVEFGESHFGFWISIKPTNVFNDFEAEKPKIIPYELYYNF